MVNLPFPHEHILPLLTLGRDSAQKSLPLRRKLWSIHGVRLSDPTFREIIKDMIENYGISVGATPRQPAGFYLIQNVDELDENVASLMSRAHSIMKRAAALKRNTYIETVEQLKLWKDK